MVGLLEGAQCPLQHGTYEVKEQSHTLPNVNIPSFLKNVSYVIKMVFRLCDLVFFITELLGK